MSATLEEIQEGLLAAVQRGEELDPKTVLAEHPEHAAALREFLRVLALIETPPPSQTAMPAQLGDFEIVRELGRGGMGIVYEARQLSLKRRVALKILPPALGGHSALASRFRREAEAAARLRHPGIVAVHSCGEVAGTPFFAMECVDGRPLSEAIRALREGRESPIPREGGERRAWAVALCAKVADALAYAHAEGIVHRDVKPANILLESDHTPRLTDFGLALDLDHEGLTRSGEVFGSPRYMSPEQAFRRQRKIDGRSDVYSLGVTLYELLTLRFPYAGATSSEYLIEVSEGRVVLPRSVDATIPRSLERVLLRALARDVEQRYASAADFAQDLRDVARHPELGDTAPSAPPASTAQDLAVSASDSVPWSRTAKGRLTLAATVVLAIALALFGIRMVRLRMARSAMEMASLHPPVALTDRQSSTIRAIAESEWGLLAEGRHPQGPQRLADAVQASVSLRRIVALDALRPYEARVSLALLDDPPPDVAVSYQWSIQELGQTPHYNLEETPIPPIVVGTREARQLLSIEEALRIDAGTGASTSPVRRTLVHTVMVRVCRDGRTAGTVARITLPTNPVEVVASYPPDYPHVESDGPLASATTLALTPKVLELELAPPRSGQNRLRATLFFPAAPRPMAVAARATLRFDSELDAFASGDVIVDAADGAPAPARVSLALRLAAATPEQEERLIERLRQPGSGFLHLSLVPDPALALEQTVFETLWGGEVAGRVPYSWRLR